MGWGFHSAVLLQLPGWSSLDDPNSGLWQATITKLKSRTLVAEWVHFALLGILVSLVETESAQFMGLMNPTAVHETLRAMQPATPTTFLDSRSIRILETLPTGFLSRDFV